MRTQTLARGLLAILLAASAQPVTRADQGDAKATEVLAAMRKAIGEKKLAALKTFSVEAALQRNLGNFQMNSDVEMTLELPDKYARTDVSSGAMSMERTSGFNGDVPLQSTMPGMVAGGGMVIRMGPGGAVPAGEKPTPEQQEQIRQASLRSSRVEVSRLMLGWFGMAHPSIAPQYTYAGPAESPDGKADVIDIKGADGFSARLFIDQQTHLPLVLSYQGAQPRMITSGAGGNVVTSGGGGVFTSTRAPQGHQPAEEERKKAAADAEARVRELQSQPPTMVEFKLFFSDWTEVDGLLFPLKLQRSVGGTADEEWTFSKVKVNPKVDPKKFQVRS